MGKRGPKARDYDPDDPKTWPRTLRNRAYKEFMIKEAMVGSRIDQSPKNKWMQEWLKGRDPNDSQTTHQVHLPFHAMELIGDINSLYRPGVGRFIPKSVLEYLLEHRGCSSYFDMETIGDPHPENQAWSTRAIVHMSLGIMLLYLSAVDPYTQKIVRRVLSVDGHEIGLSGLGRRVEQVAEDLLAHDYVDDEDFDFDLDDIADLLDD